jgi:hypothetical protein
VRPIAFPANDRNCPSDNSNAEGAQATKAANGDAIGDATYYERQSTYRGPKQSNHLPLKPSNALFQ